MFRFTAAVPKLSHKYSAFVRFASRESRGYNQVIKLVPKSQSVCLIKNGQPLHDTSLQSIEVAQNQMIKILNVRPRGEQEPEVIVEVVDHQQMKQNPKGQKKDKKAKVQVKTVQISWSISANDLIGQKKAAIESILSRGHKAEIKLHRKKRYGPPPTANQLESRQKLVSQLETLLQSLGTQIKPPVGDINSELVFTYGPSKKQD